MNDKLRQTKALPISLLLEGRRCLVIGGGRVAARKAAKLTEAGADLTVVAPAIREQIKVLGGITLFERAFEEGDLDGVYLAFAVTDDFSLNRRIVDRCREKGILCSAADANWPEADLILPASFSEDGLTVAVSTGGRSCRRSRLLRESLSRHVEFLQNVDLFILGADHSTQVPAQPCSIVGQASLYPESLCSSHEQERTRSRIRDSNEEREAALLRGSDQRKRQPCPTINNPSGFQALEKLKARRTEFEKILPCIQGVHEFMILNTCNRFEIIGLVSANTDLETILFPQHESKSRIDDVANVYLYSGNVSPLPPHNARFPNTGKRDYIQETNRVEMPLSVKGIDAFHRLAETAAGLRSQAFGETRIVAQVKEALRTAQENRWAGSFLQSWVDHALHISKEIRAAVEPNISAVEIEDLVFQWLENNNVGQASSLSIRAKSRSTADRLEALSYIKKMLIIGRGEIGQGLKKRFPEAVQISGRDDKELCTQLMDAEVVICATGSPDFIITEAHRSILKEDAVLIDLSLPRNIDPALPRVVGLSELRGAVQPANAEELLSTARKISEAHAEDYERLVNF